VSFTEANGGAADVAAPARSIVSRDGVIVAAALAAAAALAWAWLLSSAEQADGSMVAMALPAKPLSLAYLVPAFAMWAIMMVAMMVPSAAPMFLLRARIDRAQSALARSSHNLLFVVGYLVVWTFFSAAAAVAQAVLVTSGILSAANLALGSARLAAALLVVAAAYELTVAKGVCLDKCQSPLLFMLKHFRPGAAAAFRLGLLHGLYCLGCCWLLMVLLFAGGVMNLAWVALLAIVVLGQKFAPPKLRADRIVAAALAAGAVALAAI
jgi:predicted metal-binding membrane protein